MTRVAARYPDWRVGVAVNGYVTIRSKLEGVVQRYAVRVRFGYRDYIVPLTPWRPAS